MPAKSIDEKVHALEERLKKLRASKRSGTHRTDKHRQAVLGRVYLKLMRQAGSFAEDVKKVLDLNLKREAERRLFDLAPINKVRKKESE